MGKSLSSGTMGREGGKRRRSGLSVALIRVIKSFGEGKKKKDRG